MKKYIGALIIVLGITSIWFFGFKNKGIEPEVVFGALAPLTGQISVLGERMRNGMELAREDVIVSGIIDNLRIDYQDACDAKSSLNALKKFEFDNIKVISSSFCLFGIDPIVPEVERLGMILFNTAANPESVIGKKFIFSTNFTIRNDSKFLSDFVISNLKKNTVAIIHLDTSFGESYRNNFKTFFENSGGKVLHTASKLPDANDFRTELTKIKSLNPDVLIIIHFGSSLGNAIKQARELGVNSIIVGDYESEDPTVLKFAGKASEGMYISSSEPETKTKSMGDFEKRYKDRFGEYPDVLATNAYDAIMLQATAYSSCNGEVLCMTKKLEGVKKYSGVSGQITISQKDHSVTKPNIIKVVKDGKFVPLSFTSK